MMTIQRMVFREPEGRQQGLLFSLFSLICILAWVYFGIVLDGPHNMLFLGIAFGLSGFAEFLPPDRRRAAGALRTLGLGTLVLFVILLVSVPESIWG
nr:hypothetical protein [Haloarcula taiwanensis]